MDMSSLFSIDEEALAKAFQFDEDAFKDMDFSDLELDFSGMDLSGELRNPFLLLHIEITFVCLIRHDGIPELSPRQLMKHAALFSGVNDGAFIKLFIFFGQLRFLGKGF